MLTNLTPDQLEALKALAYDAIAGPYEADIERGLIRSGRTRRVIAELREPYAGATAAFLAVCDPATIHGLLDRIAKLERVICLAAHKPDIDEAIDVLEAIDAARQSEER